MGAHWTGLLIIGVLLLILFGGRGRISSLMGDMAKGITAFKKGLKDDDVIKDPSSIDAIKKDRDETTG